METKSTETAKQAEPAVTGSVTSGITQTEASQTRAELAMQAELKAMKEQLAKFQTDSLAKIQSLEEEKINLNTSLKLAEDWKAQSNAQLKIDSSLVKKIDVEEGDEITYINHAGGYEHGTVSQVNLDGSINLTVRGAHENDIYKVKDVFEMKHKNDRNVFKLAEPPSPPKKSPERFHAKGLITPGQS